jgi:prevent-host-death family protein
MRHRVGIRELRDSLSRWIERVKRGDTVVVTDHGKVVAVLSGPKPPARAKSWEEHFARLAAEGKLIRATRPFRRWEPLVIPGVSLSDAVIEDREEDI